MTKSKFDKKESRYPHGNLEQSSLNTAPPTSFISIAALVGIVNPSKGDFLKYFPGSMLDSEQIAGKNKALAKDAEKIETLSEGKKSKNFRKRLDEVGGASEKLPDGAFKNSERRTGVNTRMAVIDKADAKYSLSNNTFDNENDTKKLFSVDDKTISDLNEQIDKWLAGNMGSDENFNFGNTPLVMRSVGADMLRVLTPAEMKLCLIISV